jgi:subtilisin family serine protease
MMAIVVKPLNIRQGKPSVNANCVGYFEPGTMLNTLQKVKGDVVNGNFWWYFIGNDHYVWSGGLEIPSENTSSSIVSTTGFLEKAKNQNLLGWNITMLGIHSIWSDTNFGEGVKVAILDSGFKNDHPEFSSLRKNTWSVFGNNQDMTDTVGHGTHCAGIIGAQGERMLGIAPACELLITKVYHQDQDLSVENVMAGIEWASAQGADIVSMSLAFSEDFPGLDKLHSVIKKHAQKIIFVAAAGNFGEVEEEVNQYPAAFPECISVGALSRQGNRYYRSNISRNLTLVAPGENILSTYVDPLYKELSDTSFATPLVSGVMALLVSYVRKNNIALSPTAISEILKHTCDDAGSTGKDYQFGFGIINPVKALNKIKNYAHS